jgi:DNA polymerase I
MEMKCLHIKEIRSIQSPYIFLENTMTDDFVWMDSTWVKTRDGKPQILLFGRSVQNPNLTRVFPIMGFEPYFYAPADSKFWPSGILRRDLPVVDAKGRSIVKCVTKLPSDVPQLRDSFEWTDEADVLFDIRFVTDRKIKYAFGVDNGEIVPRDIESPIPSRLMFFDIEVRSPPQIMALPEEAKFPISSIQLMDSYTKEITVITNGVPKIADDQIACEDEHGLLEAFMTWVQDHDPDVFTGWYSNQFDIPYIIKRAEAIDHPLNRLTRIPDGWNKPRSEQRGFEWSSKIVGRQCVDMLAAFKKWYKAEGELEDWGLKAVSADKRFGDFAYENFGARIDELYRTENWETFLQYCRNDVIALDRINSRIKLFDFYDALRYITGVKAEDTLKNSKMIESLLMRRGIKPMPTRNYKNVGESFAGALVLDPQIGIHKDVAVFDLAALYPTIIRGYNVSPDIDKLIPRVITEILDEREKLRAIRMAGLADQNLKNKETVLKFIANSFYGVLGWAQFRLYDRDLALFITSTGQKINRFLQKVAMEHGHPAIYGDTDSVFLTGFPSVADGIEMQRIFNVALIDWAKENGSQLPPTIKFEKLYRRIIFKRSASSDKAAKKRYAGHIIWKDGKDTNKIDFTGIEIKRSDQSVITKTTMESFLRKVLLEDDLDAGYGIIKDAIRNIKSGNISPYDVSTPRGVKDLDADDAWSRGVRNSKSVFGINFPQGVKPRLIYVQGAYEVICVHDELRAETILSAVRVDWQKMVDKVIVNKMKSFVESCGIPWSVAILNQQTFAAFGGDEVPFKYEAKKKAFRLKRRKKE